MLNTGYVENDKKYNEIEFKGDMGLDIYDAHLRELDPQIGRWWQIDPKIENMEMWSPYASNYNNPIRFKDPLGNEGQACCKDFLDAISWVGNKLDQVGNSAPVVWINNNLNPLTPLTEALSGKSLNSGYTEDKPRVESALQLATFVVPTARAETIIANETKNIVVNTVKQSLVSLDNNAISAAVREGKKEAVKAAIGANKPIVSITAAKEFLAFGSKSELKAFMTEVGATISINGGSASQASALQKTTAGMKRALGKNDAMILAGAINNNAAVITADNKFANFMKAIGFPTWSF